MSDTILHYFRIAVSPYSLPLMEVAAKRAGLVRNQFEVEDEGRIVSIVADAEHIHRFFLVLSGLKADRDTAGSLFNTSPEFEPNATP